MKHVKVGKLLAMLLAMCMIFSLAVYAEGSGDAGEATEITFWTFQELHVEYYEKMAEKWNEANPDKQIVLKPTVYPFEDMHSNLLMASSSSTTKMRYTACPP